MSPQPERSIRVLHVDDDPAFADLAATQLERHDDRITVETAGSVAAGLERLADDTVDCVVSDYEMPGRNGIEFLEAVRADDEELPFVLFTGKGSESVASDAISAGVTDYLQKDTGTEQYELLANRVVNAVEATRAKRAQRRHLQAIETAQVGISIIDEDGVFSYVNQAYADLYGYEPGEMVGERFELTYPPGALEVVQGDVLPAIEESGSWHGETTGVRADGTTFVEDHTLVKAEGGELICSVRDKSERVAEQRAIEGLHSTVRELMRASSVDEATDVTVTAVGEVASPPANVVYRYDEDADRLEPVAWTDAVDDVVDEVPAIEPGDGVAWEVFDTGERRVVDDTSTVEGLPLPDADLGSEVLLPLRDYGLLLAGAQSPDGIPETDVGIVQTIAAHAATAIQGIRSEQELREEREFVDQAIESLNDVFYVLGPDGGLRRWNDRLRELSGYDDAEIADANFGELLPEDDRDRVIDELEATATGGPVTVESALVTADGDRIPHEFTGARLTALEGDEPGIVGIGRDISRRKAQERRLERQNDRLEEFASIISHDLRNPLSVAKGRLELAREECETDHLDAVAGAHDRMETLIEDLLAVAREGERALEVEPVDLESVTRECWAHVETASADLVVDADRTVRADPSQLQQLLENTVRNAIEHGGDDVTVTVGDLDDGFYVEDDGVGLREVDRERVFEPGYSSSGGGTGLGLNIVAGIVDAHDWEIAATESDAGGARFEITGVDSDA